ncbi:MAG: hypothetical protein WAT66_15160 [Actinomycetota bacterium]
MAETRGGEGTPYPTFNLDVPPPSPNGHRKRDAFLRGGAFGGVPAGLGVTGFLAASIVPRLSLLNLAYFNPWQRPVVACGLGGVAAGASRRLRWPSACLVGSLTAALGLWIVYGVTRLNNPVLFVERDPVRVVLADLARLAAFALPAGAVGALAGWTLRRQVAAFRRRRREPITQLPGFEP